MDLTPIEVVRLVQIVAALPEGAMVMNENDELTMLATDEHTQTLARKIREQGDREDVKAYIDAHYGKENED